MLDRIQESHLACSVLATVDYVYHLLCDASNRRKEPRCRNPDVSAAVGGPVVFAGCS